MDEKTIPLKGYTPAHKNSTGKPGHGGDDDLHYRALFEQTGECVFIVGLDLRYLTANQQALNLLGYEEQELRGMLVSEIMSLDEELGHELVLTDGTYYCPSCE